MSWRLLWGGFAVTAVAVAGLNLAVLHRRHDPATTPRRSTDEWTSVGAGPITELKVLLGQRRAWLPVLFAVVYSGTGAVYFTYAASVTQQAGLSAHASALVYLVVGAAGLLALFTRRVTDTLGVLPTAILAALAVAGGVAVLALGARAVPVALGSAVLLGAGYMVSAAVLSLWTAREFPTLPSAGLTIGVLAGGASSVLTPALAGALTATTTLPTVLLATALLAALGAAGLAFAARAAARTPATPSTVRVSRWLGSRSR